MEMNLYKLSQTQNGGYDTFGHDRERAREIAELIAEADAHLSSAGQSRADRIAALERENAELVEKVKRTRGSCNKLAKLLRDSERFIKDPSDKYAALAREHLLKAIDAALQPKAREGK